MLGLPHLSNYLSAMVEEKPIGNCLGDIYFSPALQVVIDVKGSGGCASMSRAVKVGEFALVMKEKEKLYHSSHIRLIRRPRNKEGWNSCI
jgi:hypothetical protein